MVGNRLTDEIKSTLVAYKLLKNILQTADTSIQRNNAGFPFKFVLKLFGKSVRNILTKALTENQPKLEEEERKLYG